MTLRALYRKILPQKIRDILGNYIVNPLLHMPRERLKFEVHLAEHCNLNCAGCNHFSSIAEEQFLDVGLYKQDCKRIAEITSGNLESINLMGGEPLLHPQVLEIMKISRENFYKETYIELRTNGTLLPKQAEEFWQTCKDYNITIYISKYPIRLNIVDIDEKSNKFGVKVLYSDNIDRNSIWRKEPLDLDGKQNYKKSFTHCYKSNNCFQLKNGKLYPCQYIAYINHFNNYFHKNLMVTEKDYISIYKTDSLKEILKFLSHPIPFCKYCKPPKMIGKWSVSKKEITEWL